MQFIDLRKPRCGKDFLESSRIDETTDLDFHIHILPYFFTALILSGAMYLTFIHPETIIMGQDEFIEQSQPTVSEHTLRMK